MRTTYVETFVEEGRWRNRIDGRHRGPNASFESRADAVAAGRSLARALQVEHVVTDADGTVVERSSFAVPHQLAG